MRHAQKDYFDTFSRCRCILQEFAIKNMPQTNQDLYVILITLRPHRSLLTSSQIKECLSLSATDEVLQSGYSTSQL